MAITSIVAKIQKKVHAKDYNVMWRQILLDHKQHLIDSAQPIEITAVERVTYRYRLRDLLHSRNINRSLLPVICIINNINSDEFDHPTLLIPNPNVVMKLKQFV